MAAKKTAKKTTRSTVRNRWDQELVIQGAQVEAQEEQASALAACADTLRDQSTMLDKIAEALTERNRLEGRRNEILEDGLKAMNGFFELYLARMNGG